jgi:SAM-dependent methyltransferase
MPLAEFSRYRNVAARLRAGTVRLGYNMNATRNKASKDVSDRMEPPVFHSRRFLFLRLRNALDAALKALPPGEIKRVLDYGCGNMPYRSLAEKHWPGISYTGADLAENPAAEARVGESGEIDVPSESADLVLSTQVLEHVTDPKFYLREAWRVLRPGGFLLLSTHGCWKYHPHPTDFWRWTGEGLRREISQAGFAIHNTRGVGNLAAAGVQMFQDATLRRLPRRIRPLYAFAAQRAAAVFCRMTGGDSIHEAIVFVVTAHKANNAGS